MSRNRPTVQAPAKPYPEFPLYAHARGYWCKTYRGAKINCGPWNDPEAALRFWINYRDRSEAGLDPEVSTLEALNVKGLVARWLQFKKDLVDSGELSPRTYEQCEEMGAWFIGEFGALTLIENLKVTHLDRARDNLNGKAFATIGNHVGYGRQILNYGAAEGWYPQFNFGRKFCKPKATVRRKERETQNLNRGRKEFTAAEVWQLINAAENPQFKAILWLGINCAYENRSCGILTHAHLQHARETGFLEMPRPKNHAPRMAWVWPETMTAIEAALDYDGRPKPKRGNEQFLFVTARRNPWTSLSKNREPISVEFRKLKMALGWEKRVGIGYYALRHTFETQATFADIRNCQVCIDYHMGHIDDHMRATYRETISPKMMRRLSKHVRKWLMKAKPAEDQARPELRVIA